MKSSFFEVDPQGSTANKNGFELEDRVEQCLNGAGVVSVPYKSWASFEIPAGCKRILLKNVPYTTIYGANGRGEFVLTGEGLEDTRIECRSQKVNGSVDEKIPYLFMNALYGFEERSVVIILEGNGCKNGAREWLIDQARAVKHKNIKVMTLTEFENWVDVVIK